MLLANPIQVRHPCDDYMSDVRRREAGSRRVHARDIGICKFGAFKALEIFSTGIPVLSSDLPGAERRGQFPAKWA